jgi:hypothetical protein
MLSLLIEALGVDTFSLFLFPRFAQTKGGVVVVSICTRSSLKDLMKIYPTVKRSYQTSLPRSEPRQPLEGPRLGETIVACKTAARAQLVGADSDVLEKGSGAYSDIRRPAR